MLLTYGLPISTLDVPDSEPRGQNNPAGQLAPVVIDPAKQNLPTGH